MWGVRLCILLLQRWEGFPDQDRRLNILERKARKTNFLVYWIGVAAPWAAVNCLCMTLVTLPITTFYMTPAPENINLTQIVGIIIMFFGLNFESSSDFDMVLFKQSKNEKSAEICDFGLRRYMRYPQYCGESLFWIGIYLVSWDRYSFQMWIDYPVGAVVMALFLNYSGFVMDKHMKKRPEYREYCKKVPYYTIPWPRFSK